MSHIWDVATEDRCVLLLSSPSLQLCLSDSALPSGPSQQLPSAAVKLIWGVQAPATGEKNKLKQIKVMFLRGSLPISIVNHSEKDKIKCFSGGIRLSAFRELKVKHSPIPVGGQ